MAVTVWAKGELGRGGLPDSKSTTPFSRYIYIYLFIYLFIYIMEALRKGEPRFKSSVVDRSRLMKHQ